MTEPPLTRSEWVQQRLRRAIITGELKPGELLTTTALAEKWSLSQTPLREALRILASEGLVEMSPQKAAKVAQVSYRSFAELFEIRLMLEPMALRRSLMASSKEWKSRMQDALGVLKKVVKEGDTDPFDFESAHHDFHMTLLSQCGSTQLLKIIDNLFRQSVRMRLLSASERGGLSKAVIDEHEELLDTCLNDDIENAIENYCTHIFLTLKLVLRNATSEELDLSDLNLISIHDVLHEEGADAVTT